MADVVGIAATALQVAELGIQVTALARDAATSFTDNYKDYGPVQTALLYTIFWQARSVVNRIRKHVLDDERNELLRKDPADEAETIKESYASSFNMIAVAGAIVAQIAITALSLEGVGQMHWIVTAAFLVSLIAGLLSVYFACIIQVWLGGMHSPDDVQQWLTAKRLSGTPRQWRNIPSYNSALLLIAPVQLLNWSLASLLVGVGIYHGFVFTKKLGTLDGTDANLAILLVFILFTVGALGSFLLPNIAKLLEETRASDEHLHPGNDPGALPWTETNEFGALRNAPGPGTRRNRRQVVIAALEPSITAQTISLEAQEALLRTFRAHDE